MEEFTAKALKWLPTLGITAVIVLGGILVTWILAIVIRKAMNRRRVDASLTNFIIRIIKIICLVIILIAALSKLGISTTGLIAGFSAALATVALALKDSLSDIASGIIILFTRPFVTGDFIEFGEFKGFVQKIDMVQTNLLTYDDTNVIIPNSKITTGSVNNYTAHPEMRVMIRVPVSYEADIDAVKKTLTGTMLSTDKVLRDDTHAPSVKLEEYADSALIFTARCYCHFSDYWAVYYSLTENIKKDLDRNNIPIPFNQLDVHIKNN